MTRWVTAAAFCVLAPPLALAQQPIPAAQKPGLGKVQPPAAKPQAGWPQVLPEKAPAEAATPTVPWSAQDIQLAAARCTALLKGLDVVVVAEQPIREGTECGNPAPMRLVSIGKSSPAVFSPPPLLTCDMIAALHRWLERDLQPLARKHLGASIVRVEAMSSYSCRNAYGRAKSRLSEHGRVNALDISAFVTAKGQATMVVADWGPTAREIEAQAVVARAAEEKAQTELAAGAAGPAGSPTAVAAPPRPTLSITIPGVTLELPGVPSERDTALGLVPRSRLGAPPLADLGAPAIVIPASAPAAAPVQLGPKAAFLRSAHRAACRIFGTVLGPEANNAHKNHFHVDMAERAQIRAICE